MGRIVVALLALAACGGTMWREVEVRRIEPQQQVFVIVTGKAFVIEVSETSNEALRGTALRIWSFEPRELTVREGESPDETARRLGWTPHSPDAAPHEIRVADIHYASAPGARVRANRVLGGVGFLAVVVLVIGVLLVGSVAAALGGRR